jgi:glycosyltransferase involved in cell wall biosynthesis
MKADLSLVIPAWNRAELTRQCLLSVQNCSLNLEIIVIDNGSRDNTAAMIRQDFPQVRIIRNRRNLGVTTAWRQGLKAASAEMVCISNNDIVYEPGCLEKLVEPLNRAAWIGVTSPETVMPEGSVVPFFAEPARYDPSHRERGCRVGYAGWSFVFRQADFPESFDRRFRLWYQDKDFLYTLLFRRRGNTPFRWPAPGKVPVIAAGARVSHAYHASHDQLAPDWIKGQTDRDRRAFNRKWQGQRGNQPARNIPWGQAVELDDPDWAVAAQAEPDGGMPPRVSVIIPCYNQPDLLVQTLRTVVEQHNTAIEIIVIDDGSAELPGPAIRAALGGFTGAWQVLRLARNTGPGFARRVGLGQARGEYVQYLDADDLLHPDKLSLQVAHLDSHPQLAMTYALTTSFQNGEDPCASARILGRTDQEYHHVLPDLLDRIIWTTSSCLWRRSMAGDPALWKPLYAAEDVVHDFLAGLAGQPIGQTPAEAAFVYKRIHGGNLSANIADDPAYQGEILKGYDWMWAAVTESGQTAAWAKRFARLYADKIMRFLVLRCYHEADYCVQRAAALHRPAAPPGAWLAHLFYVMSGSMAGYTLWRKWSWLARIARRRLAALTEGRGAQA